MSRFVLRHKGRVALFWLVVFLAGGYGSTKVSGRLSQQFAFPGVKSFEADQAVQRSFGNGGGVVPLVPVITLPAGTTVGDPGVRAQLGRAFAVVARNPRLRVASYASTGDQGFVGDGGRVTFGLVMQPQQATFTPGPDPAPGLVAALRAALPAGTTVVVTGLDELQVGGGQSAGPGVLGEILLGALGALLVLAFVFGSLMAFVPLVIAAVSILATFLVILGLTTITDVSFIIQFLVGLIGLGVAIDYSLLIVTRWREERAHGHDIDEAVHRAMASAGRAVVFSGVTVAIGLVALVTLSIPFLRSIGIGGMLIPLVSVLVTVTLLPVILATVGRRLDWPHLRSDAAAGRGWSAWARGVVHRRWLATAAALVILGALAFAASSLVIGQPQAGSLAKSGPAYQGLKQLEAAGIPAGVLSPLEVLVRGGDDPNAMAARLRQVPGVRAAVAPNEPAWRHGTSALVDVLPVTEPSTAAGTATTNRVRAAAAEVAPSAQVAGAGADQVDGTHAPYGRFPLMLGLVALATFVLLARALRSLVLPLKAVVLNLLSLAATYGVLVLVWQRGFGSRAIWGIPATGSITNWVPLVTFAFLFGLSMDYEVFLLTRMREGYDATGSTSAAVVEGIGRTGRLVTSAALILFLAFVALASAPNTQLKIFATGLGAGILLDATVVRALLAPALVSLFGAWNWLLPPWAAKALGLRAATARSRLPGGAR